MSMTRNANPRAQAAEVIKQFGAISLPVPVLRLAKFLGAEVRSSPLDMELSGMIFIKSGKPIIGVNTLHHAHRQRFTVGHEIGHLVMHRGLIEQEVHVDKSFPVLMRDASSATGAHKIEIQANQFAAEILMPENHLRELLEAQPFDIDDEGPLDLWAAKFRVSRQALEYRIRNLS